MKSFFFISTISSALVYQAAAHAVVTQVVGDNGVQTTGFGVIDGVSRDGTSEQDFQIDTSVFKNLQTNPCGETIGGGTVDIATNLAAVETQGNGQLPSLTSDLTINMIIHQVNADGGGPFFAVVNTDGTGANWTSAEVTVQAPGAHGLIDGGALDSPLAVQLPAGTVCTGGTNGDACLIRVSNGGDGSIAVGPGPFGSCLAVQNPGATSGSAATNTTTTTTTGNTTTTTTGNTTTTGTGRRHGHHRNNRNNKKRMEKISKRYLAKKSLKNNEAFVKRMLELKERTLGKRAMNLNAVDILTLKTITGAAIDTPIDLAAGIDSTLPDGGRSQIDTANAFISVQQAENLKEAVRQALTDAIETIASNPDVKVANPTTSDDDIAAGEARAVAALADGSLKSVSVLPSGVLGGEIRGELGQNALGVQTATDLAAAQTAAATTSAAAATVTSSSAAAAVTSAATSATATSGSGFIDLGNKKRKRTFMFKSSRH